MRFGILGPLSVTDGGRDVAITAGRDRVVLATLLLNNTRIVGVEELIDAVWADDPPATARGQLQTCISRLRRLLPADMIATDPAGYAVTVPGADLDAAVFARLTAEARATAGSDGDKAAAMFREALALWRGPALTGLDTPAVRQSAGVLDEQRAAAMEDWIDLELEAGGTRELAADLAGMVERYPLRERLRAQLMTCLCQIGRQAEALAEYRRVCTLLRDELGIEPGPALQDLHRRILSGEVVPGHAAHAASPAPRNLPRTVGDFTGRGDAVSRLLAAATRTTVLAIDGMAGSGKTTLALRVAGLLADAYPDAQLFLDLHGHGERAPVEPEAALLALLRQLGIEGERVPTDLDDRAALWRSELAARRGLVILDNAASSAQIGLLLPASPGSLALVTSRRRLIGLDGVHPESLPVLDEPDAVAMLTKIVGERVTAEPEASLALVRRCGCLPLAIRLAGSRLAHRPRWAVSDLVRRLGESALPELAAEDRTVASAFAFSYGQLPARMQNVFRLLSLYPSDRFGVPAAAALADLSLDDVQDVLDELVNVHLVDEPAPGRYRLHDLVKQYASSLVDGEPPDLRRSALQRLVDFHLHASIALNFSREAHAAANDYAVGTPPRPDLVERAVADPDWLETQSRDLVALARIATEIGDHRTGWLLARVNWQFLYFRNYCDVLIAVHTQGLAAATASGDARGVALMSNYLASGLVRVGRYAEALQRISVMLDYHERARDSAGAARARSNIGVVLLRLGRLREALAAANQAYWAWPQRDVEGIARRNSESASALIQLGRHPEALRRARLALQGAVECRSASLKASCLMDVAEARACLGDLDAARRLLLAALRITRQLHQQVTKIEVLRVLGQVEARSGRSEQAVDWYLAALSLARERDQSPNIAQVSNGLGVALATVGDLGGAAELHRNALAIARRINLPVEQGRALSGLAACAAAAGDEPAARRLWQQAREIFTATGAADRFDVEARLAALDTRPGADHLRPAPDGGTMEW
ncbi:AfsR/SARP family transcriptional regulator [Mangrovihabitans endophyticus]|uniref:SARP family transcriptional regulator n=1 Tax=Mangrovihabitans endophyticus TaxID=1751298 RepID=A0A8J3BWW7_9ACTN|nr:AfsR/SARP family transcriptional regulator [Mangrovihabitans endophyticus]GGK82219.1 SARP family transcriptional regulator [Mangrovihabitans endophyticus]